MQESYDAVEYLRFICFASKKKITRNIGDPIFENVNPRIFNRVIEKSGLNNGIKDSRQKIVFHTLRHTFASWMIQNGMPSPLISQLLGHSSINVTMRYAHLAPSQAQEAVNIISRYLGFLDKENFTESRKNGQNYTEFKENSTELRKQEQNIAELVVK